MFVSVLITPTSSVCDHGSVMATASDHMVRLQNELTMALDIIRLI